MPTASSRPFRSQLLHYLPAYRVLICKECRYAIQPSGISRHLKELHHIYRSDRQELMEYVQSLDLADPGDVVLPEPHEAPVPFLPTESGLVCGVDGCGHLCITFKRMKNHWATVHRGVTADGAQWRPVRLQTFFRGNQLRYFIVCESSTPTSEAKRSSDLDSAISPIETEPGDDTDYSNWSPADLELLENFRTSALLDICESLEFKGLWQTIIPQLACHHSFLKHGVLACSALHLAYCRPSERRRYQLMAACHQSIALPEFRIAIAKPTEENCNALIAFSQLLLINCFAAEDPDENLLLVGGKHESGLPDWLQIIRGSCTIFSSVWEFVKEGPLAPLFEERNLRMLNEPLLMSQNPEHARQLHRLIHLTNFGNSSSSSVAEKFSQGYVSSLPGALLELSVAFSKALVARERGFFTVSTALHIWPARVSQGYLDLLKERDPAALVVLAHYCILLKPLESNWYMSGFRERLLTRIYNQLDEEWRPRLQWPLEEIGLDFDSPP
jgi:hypothetical protein